MCQRQAVKFSHVIHMREGGKEGEEEEEGVGGEEVVKEGGGITKAGLKAEAVLETCLDKCEPMHRVGLNKLLGYKQRPAAGGNKVLGWIREQGSLLLFFFY